MAKIGLNSFRYSILKSDVNGTPTYEGAKTPAKAISCSVDVTNNSASLYADDALAESDTSFAGGTITAGIDRTDDQTMADLLGHEVDEEKGLVRNANDIAPYVGFGRVVAEMVNNVPQYTAEVLYKCKFSEPSQSDSTKGESVEFSTYELSGSVSALSDGKWSVKKTFKTKAEAVGFIEDLFKATA